MITINLRSNLDRGLVRSNKSECLLVNKLVWQVNRILVNLSAAGLAHPNRTQQRLALIKWLVRVRKTQLIQCKNRCWRSNSRKTWKPPSGTLSKPAGSWSISWPRTATARASPLLGVLWTVWLLSCVRVIWQRSKKLIPPRGQQMWIRILCSISNCQ